MQNTKQLAGKITVLGAGAWGTAVAMALAARHDVLLWGRNAHAMQDVAASARKPRLPARLHAAAGARTSRPTSTPRWRTWRRRPAPRRC